MVKDPLLSVQDRKFNIMAGQCVTPDTVSDFANKDTSRLQGKVGEVLIRKSPYLNVLDGGTIENVSDTVRSVVQERAVVAASLVKPVFTADISMCGTRGGQDRVGSTEYSYALESLRGRGPRVCVKTSRTAFKGSYLQAQMSLEKAILQIMNSDVRSTLHLRSGVKYVCSSSRAFETSLTGDMQNIDVQFAQFNPDSPMSFNTLHKLGTFLSEEMIAEPFESEGGTMFKVIAGADQIEHFRQELDIKADIRALAAGRYQLGDKAIEGYQFTGPYRGFAFGIDPQPLRSNGFNGSGDLTLIEPEIPVVTTKGVGARRNPDWTQAAFEVGFILASESFKRLTPEAYTGEGTFKFAPQMFMGELRWKNLEDNDCNEWQDFGQHLYQIQRAYQPVRPQNVIPFLYQRCRFANDLVHCASASNGL